VAVSELILSPLNSHASALSVGTTEDQQLTSLTHEFIDTARRPGGSGGDNDDGRSQKDDRLNVVTRALRLPEIIGAVLDHASYVAEAGSSVIDDGDDDNRIEDSDTRADEYIDVHHVGTVVGIDHATLRAAALVNQTWFASALPFLWRRPSERALAADAITTPERRKMYAAHIREVYLSGRSALWHALGGAQSVEGKAKRSLVR
jgi:hypothetical protein